MKIITFVISKTLIRAKDDLEYTSKHLAKEAINFAPKSTPTKHAIPATNEAKTAAYLHKEKCQLQ